MGDILLLLVLVALLLQVFSLLQTRSLSKWYIGSWGSAAKWSSISFRLLTLSQPRSVSIHYAGAGHFLFKQTYSFKAFLNFFVDWLINDRLDIRESLDWWRITIFDCLFLLLFLWSALLSVNRNLSPALSRSLQGFDHNLRLTQFNSIGSLCQNLSPGSINTWFNYFFGLFNKDSLLFLQVPIFWIPN